MAGVQGTPEPGAPELCEVFYRVQAKHDRLRPQVLQALDSGEIYCFALANIYVDPNYHNLSHQGDVEALHLLEVFYRNRAKQDPLRTQIVQALDSGELDYLALANIYADPKCHSLSHQGVAQALQHKGVEVEPPADHTPVTKTMLAALLSFYCPQHLPWHDLCLRGDSLTESLYSLQLSQRLCESHLPHDVFFLTVEDVLFVHPSIRQNHLVLLADLMFASEIRPAKCVRRPGLRYDPASAEHTLQAARHRGKSLLKARQGKGVEVEPPADQTPLTNTVLAQTASRRMSAHVTAEFI